MTARLHVHFVAVFNQLLHLVSIVAHHPTTVPVWAQNTRTLSICVQSAGDAVSCRAKQQSSHEVPGQTLEVNLFDLETIAFHHGMNGRLNRRPRQHWIQAGCHRDSRPQLFRP